MSELSKNLANVCCNKNDYIAQEGLKQLLDGHFAPFLR